MSSESFLIKEHKIQASHIRGVDRSVRNEQNSHLKLVVNQYIPKNNLEPKSGDFTLVFAPGIGHSKELWEPFFDDVLSSGRIPIRSIWTLDPVNGGRSYLENHLKIGDEVDWIDFARDIWHMTNHFQHDMPSPIIGLGQSLGVGMISMVASWHPRLFSGIVSMEAGLGPFGRYIEGAWPKRDKSYPGIYISKRKDKWPSKQEARKFFQKRPYFAAFDPRVLEKVLEYDLRNIYPTGESNFTPVTTENQPVTLTVPKEIEMALWVAPDPPLTGRRRRPDDRTPREDVETVPGAAFRPEGYRLNAVLPQLYPPILYIWADKSPLTIEPVRKRIIDMTGTGIGGSGGANVKDAIGNAMVQEAMVGGTHTVSLDNPKDCAEEATRWLSILKQKLDKERLEERPPFHGGVEPELIERFAKL